MNMKRTACLVLAAMLCLLLCACDPGHYPIEREALNDVSGIELIEYENPNQKHFASWVPNQFYRLTPFETSNATVLETLPADKTEEFLDAFSETYILHTYYAYNSPKDICIRVNYTNGNFLIIWANYVDGTHAGYIGEYSSDGTVLSFWGSFSSLKDYTNLVYQYFSHCLT